MKITYLLVILLLLVPIVLAEENQTNATQSNQTVVAPVCSDIQCDAACVKCSDGKCHETTFICREKLRINKVFPTSIDLGTTDINVLLENYGTVDLTNVHVEVKGDGISTTDSQTLDKLEIGKEDYAGITVNATKTGDIELLVGYFTNDIELDSKDTISLTVKKLQVAQYNQTELEDELNKSKQDYLDLEKEYQDKQSNGYLVDIVSNDMNDLDSAIKDARDALLEGDYKKADLNIKKAQGLSSDIKTQLNSTQKKQTSFSDQLKSYLIYAGSIAAAIISIITAWKLTRTHVINKDNLKGLHNRGKESISVLKNVIKKEETIIKKEEAKKSKKKKKEDKEEKKIPEEDSEE